MQLYFPSPRLILLGEDRDERRTKGGTIQTGGYTFVRFVENEEQFRQFCNRLDAVKDHIANLNASHRSREISDAEYHQQLESRWLNVSVRCFVRSYGLASVPLDVRRSIDECIRGLGTDIMSDVIGDWPQARCISVSEDDSFDFSAFNY